MIVTPAGGGPGDPGRSPPRWAGTCCCPASDGGPPAALGLHVDLPDPTQSAAGLATLVELSRLLGHGAAARTAFTRFALTLRGDLAVRRPDLAGVVRRSTAQPPLNGRPVTVTTEQAVIAYDAAQPAPAAGRAVPGWASAPRLGTPVLDYPYVITTSSAAPAARRPGSSSRPLGRALRRRGGPLRRLPVGRRRRGRHARLLRPEGSPSSSSTWPAATPSQAQTTLEVWRKLELGSRDLVLIDTSAAMATPVAPAA